MLAWVALRAEGTFDRWTSRQVESVGGQGGMGELELGDEVELPPPDLSSVSSGGGSRLASSDAHRSRSVGRTRHWLDDGTLGSVFA